MVPEFGGNRSLLEAELDHVSTVYLLLGGNPLVHSISNDSRQQSGDLQENGLENGES